MIIPTRGGINQSCGVQLSYSFNKLYLRLVCQLDLTPAFVVENPSNNGRVILVFADHQLQLSLKLGLVICRRDGIADIDSRLHRWHVLIHEESQPVTGVIEQIWLDFDLTQCQYATQEASSWQPTYVFSNHVHPQPFQEEQIRLHRFERRWYLDAIWPVPLIQRAKVENELSI